MIIRIAILLLLALPAYAMQIGDSVTNNYSTARLMIDRQAISPGEPLWVALHLDLVEDWHTYWRNPGDSGIPTSIDWALPEGFTASDIHWPAPIRFEMAGIVNYGYADDAYHLVQITPPQELQGKSVTLQAKASWLICKDICVPEYAEFDVTVPTLKQRIKQSGSFTELLRIIPSTSVKVSAPFNYDKSQLWLAFEDTSDLPINPLYFGDMQFYPIDNNVIANDAPYTFNKLQFVFRKAHETPQSFRGVVVAGDESFEVTAQYDPQLALQAGNPQSMLGFVPALLLAFIGGVILNLMPCVLPVLSLKLLHLSKHTQRREMLSHAVSYTAGVLTFFTILSISLIVLQSQGAAIGWGFQLQSPAFVAALVLIMWLVGLNLSGLYDMPVLFGTFGASHTSGHSRSGSFFTGALAVLVATPCTAPFMAPAIGYALSQPPILLISIFLALGLGLAAPFLLIAALPAAHRFLPKPGAWMVRFKQCLAFPMYGTAVWLIWVLTRQSGTDALFIILTMLVGVSWATWLLTIMRGAWRYAVMGLLCIIVAIGMIFITSLDSDAPALSDKAIAYSEATLESLRNNNIPVFIYATADWCVTCKINEKLVLNNENVQALFDGSDVTIMRADWTSYDEEITALLTRHGRAGVPLYLYYPPQGEVVILPQLLTQNMIEKTLR